MEVTGTDTLTVAACHSVTQATRYGYLQKIKDLVESGHSVDFCDNRGWRPIHEAAAADYVDCLQFLLTQESTNVNWQTFDGRTALLLAATDGQLSSVTTLLEHNADTNIVDCMNDSALLAAVRVGSLPCVQLLLTYNASVNHQNYNQLTALHIAVTVNRVDIVELLLDHGASIELRDELGITAIFLASQHGHTDCLRVLLQYLQTTNQLTVVNYCAEDGASPLFLASQEGHFDCVQLLLHNGADANLTTTEPVALPLHAALQFNHVRCVELLLPFTNHYVISLCSVSPFYFSMMHNDTVATSYLIQSNVDVNAAYESVEDDEYQPKVLRYFNTDVRFGRMFTPLVLCAFNEYSMEHVECLLSAGACPDACGACRVPPILAALDMSNIELVKRLVSAGASVNVYHEHVTGNMALVVCLHYWRGLLIMLRCGAEVDSLLRLQTDTVDTLLLWRLAAEARYLMTRRGITVTQVLHRLLQFTATCSTQLDCRLAGYVDSVTDWNQLLTLTASPRRLTHLCRLSVRHCFTSQQLVTDDVIRGLPLPQQVQDYLLYTEFQCTLHLIVSVIKQQIFSFHSLFNIANTELFTFRHLVVC